MDDVINVITEKLGGFTAEQDVTRIYEVLDALEAAERDLPPSDATRRLAIERRLYFLAALDDHIDPRWDGARRPPVAAPPPPSHQGPVYPTGQVDPSDIADPAERAEYERAVAVSKAYARWYDTQSQLRRIDERATRFLELLLREQYRDTAAERDEFEALLAASPLDEARRQAVRALFPFASQ